MRSELSVHPAPGKPRLFWISQMRDRAVVFDFDDTLIASRNDRAGRLLGALSKFGCDPDERQLSNAWGLPFEQLVIKLAPTVRHRYSEFLLFYANELTAAPPMPAPGLEDALVLLHANSVLFVHSSSHAFLVRVDLQSINALRYFDLVIGSNLYMGAKPATSTLAGFSNFLTSSCPDVRMSFYVGNSRVDAELAHNARLPFVGVNYGWPAASDFGKGREAFPVASSMIEVAHIIRDTSDSVS